MRIVKWDEFVKLPAGTLYCESDAYYSFDVILIKGDQLYIDGNPSDYYEQTLTGIDAKSSHEAFQRIDEMQENSKVSYPLEESESRNGLFEYGEGKQYLIYEYDDLLLFKSWIENAISVAQLNISR